MLFIVNWYIARFEGFVDRCLWYLWIYMRYSRHPKVFLGGPQMKLRHFFELIFLIFLSLLKSDQLLVGIENTYSHSLYSLAGRLAFIWLNSIDSTLIRHHNTLDCINSYCIQKKHLQRHFCTSFNFLFYFFQFYKSR